MMHSLYSKLVVITLAIMLFSGLLAFLAVNTYYHQILKIENDEKNMMILQNITTFISDNDEIDLADFLQAEANVGYKLYVIDKERNGTFYGEPFRIENLDDQAIDDVFEGKPYHGMANLPSETFVTGFFANELKNTVGLAFTHNNEQYALFLRPDIKLLFSEIHYLLAGLLLLMGIISLLAMLIVAKKLIDPITKLTVATEKVGAEQLIHSLPTNRRDEIGQLAQSFERMANKLAENDRLRKEFISDVSHDLQTPLLNIKGYADLLLQNDLPDDEREKYIHIIKTETNRLSTLAKQLLLLTSLDQLSSPLVIEPFRLDEQIKSIVRNFHWRLEDENLAIELNLPATTFKADANFLEKVWENLLSNAFKYTEQGTITVTIINKSNEVTVIVQDTGIGMEAAKLARIYDRFYRIDTARTKTVEGTGLGLSIVQKIVHLHGGVITIDSAVNQGTTCKVILPKL